MLFTLVKSYNFNAKVKKLINKLYDFGLKFNAHIVQIHWEMQGFKKSMKLYTDRCNS